MQQSRQLTAITERADDRFVALCAALDIASQGSTRDEARKNLLEAVEGFLETASQKEIESRLGAERYVESLEVRVG